MRGRGLAFVAGRAAGKNRAYEQQMTQQQPASPQQSNQSDELERLSQMHASGELTDAEFSQAKKKVLSGK